MGSRGNKFQIQKNCAKTGKISSSVTFHRYFQEFHLNFTICFRHLVLLAMIIYFVLEQSYGSLYCIVNILDTKFLSTSSWNFWRIPS